MAKTKETKKQVGVADFIAAWEGSENIGEVAEKTGQSTTTVSVRAAKLRKLGLPIKRFAKKNKGFSLQEAIEALAKAQGKTTKAIQAEVDQANAKKAIAEDQKKPKRKAS